MIDFSEPARRFAAAELHAGRLPMWNPYNFAGVPFIWPKFSPFGPAMRHGVAGDAGLEPTAGRHRGRFGRYLFCRRVLVVSFWPAVIAAWCYPLTGFFVFWQGYATSLPVVWLPWILLAVDKTARGAGTLASIGLSVVTCLVLISGQLDTALQVLLASGLYSLWCLYDAQPREWFQRKPEAPR